MTDRLLIVGWDGADWEILDDLIARDQLPTVRRMIEDGFRAELASTTPAHSWAAWPSFLTGLHPAGHGVFDFIERDPRDPQRRVPATSRSIRAPTFLEMLSHAEVEVRCGNVPVTYPPPEVKGRIIAGGAIPRGAPFVFPPSWADELDRRAPFPTNGMAWTRFKGDPESFLNEVEATVDARTAAFDTLLEGDWSVGVCVYVATDRIQHPLGRYLLPSHPDFAELAGTALAERLRTIYRTLDAHLGRLAAAAGDGATVVLMSDHGFRPVTRLADLSRILEHLGFSEPARSARTTARVRQSSSIRRLVRTKFGRAMRGRVRVPSTVSWNRTRAYKPISGSGVSVNLAGREPEGIVRPEDYERVRAEVREALLSYRDEGTGERPFADVRSREELPAGAFAELAPDLIPSSAPLWSLGHSVGALSAPTEWPSATHRNTGILVAAGGRVRGAPSERPFVGDLAATALAFCGLDAPGLDGRVITAITGPFDPRRTAPIEPSRSHEAASSMTDEEAELMADHLRELGYIE